MHWLWKSLSFAALAMIASIGHADAAGRERPSNSLTPGAFNADVTPATIHRTICKSGWTATVRPPTRETNALKRKQLKSWGYSDVVMAHYEEDHRVPLEIGGDPSDPKNLWPEPYDTLWGARVKDKLETYTKRQICAHRMTLIEGRAIFIGDWIAEFKARCGSTPKASCHPR